MKCIGQPFVVLAGPVGEPVQRAADGRRPERERSEGAQRCAAEYVGRVVGPERDAGDGHERWMSATTPPLRWRSRMAKAIA